MQGTTKTGLSASPRKNVHRTKNVVDVKNLLSCAYTRQAPLSLKPFAGLFNPYSKGCSVLCNHPTTTEMRNVVKQAKSSWTVEGKAFTFTSDQLKNGKGKKDNRLSIDNPDHVIPEEFFKRYTDTDSRPLTPTPTVASGRTRASAIGSHYNARRCVTPEPASSNDGKERKQIILDLRRSHSQETLYYNTNSDLSPRPQSGTSSWMQLPQPKVLKEHSIVINQLENEVNDMAEIQEEEENAEDDLNADTDSKKSVCINAMDQDVDDDTPRRRGKRRKSKLKALILATVTFVPNQDPETHIATIDDSPNASARGSIVPSINTPLPSSRAQRRIDSFDNYDKSFFLDEEALRILRLGLDVEMVENVFDPYRHRALQEALRTISPEKLGVESEAVRLIREELNLPEIDHQKWMYLPRKYSRSSARFELPMENRELGKLSPLEYLSKYVFVDQDKKQLFHRIFIKYLPKDKVVEDKEHDEFFAASMNQRNLDRVLSYDMIDNALKDVLGFHGTDEKIAEVRALLQLNDTNETAIDFRTWCGIVAFAERKITTLDDSKNEIEIADFESLDKRMKAIKPSENLLAILNIIKK